jgi:hypothetical protein
MSSDSAKFDKDGGLTLLVSGLFPQFEQNIKNIIEPSFGKDWGVTLTVTRLADTDVVGGVTKDYALLHISKEAFVSTFRISTIALFIRNCNVPVVFPTYESRLDRTIAREGMWGSNMMKMFRTRAYMFPEQEKYVYWWKICPPIRECDPYALHNNGTHSWCSYLMSRYSENQYTYWDSLPVFSPASVFEEAEEEELWEDEEEKKCCEENW